MRKREKLEKLERLEKLEWNGYMTVEAALVLSIVFAVYVFLIQSFLWIYDRCVLEQDVAALLLRCANEREENLESFLQQESAKLMPENYLWMELQEPKLKKQGWRLEISGTGKAEQFSDCQISYEAWCFTPTQWLRRKHKIEQEKKQEKE